jgi:hypothetical protein
MTSVLTFGGLNYQAGNPVRNEFIAVRREMAELRALVQAQSVDIKMLRTELGKLASGDLPELASEKVGSAGPVTTATTAANSASGPGAGVASIRRL